MRTKIGRGIIILLFSLLLSGLNCYGITEIKLEKEPLHLRRSIPQIQGNSIVFDKGIVDRVDLDLYVSLYNEMTIENNKEFSDIFNFGTVAPGFTVHFKDKKTRAGFLSSLSRELDYNDFWEKVSGLYLEHDILPNQHIAIGVRRRLPIGYEGGMSSVKHPFVMRSQIGRRFGNVYGFGINNTAQYKYLDYDIGVYDGSRFMNKLFNGTEFAGLVQFKPLAKFEERFGKLKLGTGIDTGNSDGSFNVFSANALYEYKRLYLDFEYAYADGYTRGKVNPNKYGGFYTTLGYKITDKLKILGRYDYLRNQSADKNSTEYSAGITYSLKPGLDFLVNYVLVDSDYEKSIQHKIYLGTRFNLGEFANNL